MSPTLRGSLLAATALALVGSPVAASDLVEGYPLAAGQALRYSAAGLALLVVARGRLPRLQARELVGLIALSATGLVLFNLFVIEGVCETDPATIGVIVGCVPVVLALAGPLLEGRQVTGRVVVAAVVVAGAPPGCRAGRRGGGRRGHAQGPLWEGTCARRHLISPMCFSTPSIGSVTRAFAYGRAGPTSTSIRTASRRTPRPLT